MEPRGEFQAAQPVAQTKKKNTGLVMAVIFLALCSLVLGGLYCYEKFIAKGNGSAIANTGNSEKCDLADVDKIDGVNKEEILGVATADEDLKVRELIDDIYDAWYEANASSGERVYGYDGPMLELDNGNWIQASKYYGVKVHDYNDAGTSAIEAALNDSGMKKDENYYTNVQSYNGDYYVGNGIVCKLSTWIEHPYTVHGVDCTGENWVSDENAELLDGLIAAGDFVPTFGVNVRNIRTQKSGYQSITVSMIDSALMYYRENADSEWKFFASAQDILSCDRYDTDELKAAFNGDRCYLSDGSLSKVK